MSISRFLPIRQPEVAITAGGVAANVANIASRRAGRASDELTLFPTNVEKLLRCSNQRPYFPGPVRLGIFRSPFTTGGKSFTSSYTSVMNRSLLCFVSPRVVAS